MHEAVHVTGGLLSTMHSLLQQVNGSHANPVYQVSAQPGVCRNVGTGEFGQPISADTKPCQAIPGVHLYPCGHMEGL
jgi:hypothetical protein